MYSTTSPNKFKSPPLYRQRHANNFTAFFLKTQEMTMSSNNKMHVTAPSNLTVVSSTPVEPGKTHHLSVLDHSMGLHTVHLIFYYHNNPIKLFDVDQARVSLSEALSLYPTVTGRLVRGESGNWEVKCVDAGMRVLQSKVGVTLDEWLRSASSDDERKLTVWDAMPEEPYTWSPFRIQLNAFEGGGLAMGLSCTHMLADPTCAILFLKAWSQAHLGEPVDHPLIPDAVLLSARQIPNPISKSAKHYATKALSEASSTKMGSATFKFSDEMIRTHLSEIHGKCAKATPFDLLAALFWIRIAALKPPKSDGSHSMSVCVDFRKRLQEPLPYGYFGNAQYFSLLSLKNDELETGGVAQVAGRVHNHMSSLDEEEFWSAIDWLDSRKDEGGKLEAPFRMYGPELTCISMEHLISSTGSKYEENVPSIYSVMLEKDAKPVHVSCSIDNVDGEGLILVMPSPENGLGRTVTVTLPQEEVAKLCTDEAILQLKPTIMFSC